MALFGKGSSNKGGRRSAVASMTDDPQAALRAMAEESAKIDEEQVRIQQDIYKMLDQGRGSITDLWAPPRMKIQYDNIEMGDECLAIFTVSNWPTELSYGWLNRLLDDPNLVDVKIDVSMHIHPIRREYALAYMGDKYTSARSSSEAEYEKGKVRADNQKIYTDQMKTADLVRDMLEEQNENLFQVSLIIGVYGEQQFEINPETGLEELVKTQHEDLVDKTNRVKKALADNSRGGFGIKSLLHQQRDGIKSLLPLGYGGLHSFQNFYTSALATCYPFTQGSLQTDDGILYGVSLASGQPIFFDIFDRSWVKSYNCIVMGTKGSGKSATVKTLLGRYAIKGTQIFVIDPAITSQGEYTNLATSLNGTVVDFGGHDGIYMNPFELVAPSNRNVAGKKKNELAESIYMAKKRYLVGLLSLMRTIYEKDNEFHVETVSFGSVVSTLIDRLYMFKEISLGGDRWDFRQWEPDNMPKLSDLYMMADRYVRIVTNYNTREKLRGWAADKTNRDGSLINARDPEVKITYGYYSYVINHDHALWGEDELTSLQHLKRILADYVNTDSEQSFSEKSHLFDGQKKADLTNQCVIFRFGNVSDDIKGLSTYMCFEMINSRVRSGASGGYRDKIVVLDEAWKLIKDGKARQYLEALYREGRKQNTGVWLISQSYKDFTGDNEVFSKYAETKIIMAVPDEEVTMLAEDIELSNSMQTIINEKDGVASAGMGILHINGTGGKRETVAFYCQMTELELAIADTVEASKPPLTAAEILGPERARALGVG